MSLILCVSAKATGSFCLLLVQFRQKLVEGLSRNSARGFCHGNEAGKFPSKWFTQVQGSVASSSSGMDGNCCSATLWWDRETDPREIYLHREQLRERGAAALSRGLSGSPRVGSAERRSRSDLRVGDLQPLAKASGDTQSTTDLTRLPPPNLCNLQSRVRVLNLRTVYPCLNLPCSVSYTPAGASFCLTHLQNLTSPLPMCRDHQRN